MLRAEAPPGNKAPGWIRPEPYLPRRRTDLRDAVPALPTGAYALLLVTGAAFAIERYRAFMNGYDRLVLIGTVRVLVVLGWQWKPLCVLAVAIGVLSLVSIRQYGGGVVAVYHPLRLPT